jgi:hypothetical protein
MCTNRIMCLYRIEIRCRGDTIPSNFLCRWPHDPVRTQSAQKRFCCLKGRGPFKHFLQRRECSRSHGLSIDNTHTPSSLVILQYLLGEEGASPDFFCPFYCKFLNWRIYQKTSWNLTTILIHMLFKRKYHPNRSHPTISKAIL